MTIRGYQKPLYILPFDHRGSFETGMFGWKGDLTAEQRSRLMEIADKCPVHRTLKSEVDIRSTEEPGP